VICVPPPGKHISLVICVAPRRKHRSPVICVPPPGKHRSLVICVSPPGKHRCLVICVPPPGKHRSLVICVPPPGKHRFLVICVPPPGKHISLAICVARPGKHISLVICVPPPGKHISLTSDRENENRCCVFTFCRILEKTCNDSKEMYKKGRYMCKVFVVVANLNLLLLKRSFCRWCKRTQHCWRATHNIVGCYMFCPFAHTVTCCCVLLGVVVQSLKPVKRIYANGHNLLVQLCWDFVSSTDT